MQECLQAEEGLRARIARLEKQLADSEAEVSSRMMDLDEAAREADQLKVDVRNYRKNADELEDKVREMEDLCAQYRKKLKESKMKLMRSHFGDKKANSRMDEMLAVNEELEDKLSELYEALTKMEGQSTKAMKKVVGLNIEKLMKRSNKARAQVKAVRDGEETESADEISPSKLQILEDPDVSDVSYEYRKKKKAQDELADDSNSSGLKTDSDPDEDAPEKKEIEDLIKTKTQRSD